jgi:hypothetical protein
MRTMSDAGTVDDAFLARTLEEQMMAAIHAHPILLGVPDPLSRAEHAVDEAWERNR